MPSANIVKEIDVIRTPRVVQLESIFDIALSERSKETWQIDFDLPKEWNIGVIVGASGSGKTTLVQELWGDHIIESWEWDNKKSVIDSFPKDMGIKDITRLLSQVGFSSPPSWLRPYHVLSNGEKFRVHIARTLAERPDLSVIDEFTSVVDRTVAKIGSAAIQKAVRKRNHKLIAVSCHYDILDWLEPDWVYQPSTGEYYTGRYLHQRPKIEIEVKRVHHRSWAMFRKYHYLNTSLNKSAQCYCAFFDRIPVAFTAVLHFPHPKTKNIKREHRTVCLPDYQGIGIGNALSNHIGDYFVSCGFRYMSQTSHPAMIDYRNSSDKWKMTIPPTRKKAHGAKSGRRRWRVQTKRNIASFEYVKRNSITQFSKIDEMRVNPDA